MKKSQFIQSRLWILAALAGIGLMFAVVASPGLAAGNTLRLSCSAQVYQAFGPEFFKSFTAQKGIEVDLFVGSSDAAVQRLTNDMADLAASAKTLYHRHQEYGYQEIAFAKDPLVLFTNANVTVKSLDKQEIQGIFGGSITNWNQVGGDDHPIVTVVPGQHTGAFWNFRSRFLPGRELQYDFMSYKSTMVVELARNYPFVISFITRAAVYEVPQLNILKVDNVSADDPAYPYFQTFSFVTKGSPEPGAKNFIDFCLTGDGRNMLEKKGIIFMDQ